VDGLRGDPLRFELARHPPCIHSVANCALGRR
jgi:hypothetical protein